MGDMIHCHECDGKGLIGMKVGARHVCNLCDGEGKHADRRAPSPSDKPATGEAREMMRLARHWANKAFDHGASETGEDTRPAEVAAERAFKEALAAHAAERDRAVMAGARSMFDAKELEWLCFAQNAENMMNQSPEGKYRQGWRDACCEFARQARDPEFRKTLIETHGAAIASAPSPAGGQND